MTKDQFCLRAGRLDEGVSIVADNLSVTFHSLFLAVCVGGAATDVTVYLLIAIDFASNMFWSGLVFYRVKSGGERGRRACGDVLKVLVLCETLEVVMPLGYLACFVAAFYGPNARVLGNVKNGYWQYVETTGI